MQQRTSTRRTVAVVTLAVTLMALSNRPALADADESAPKTIVGAWSIEVTRRDCATGVPLGPPLNSLVTFHQGGTVSEAAGGLTFAPGQRSPGHGVWTRTGQTYRQFMVALILFDTPPNLPGTPGFDPSLPVSPGFFAGWQTITHTVTPTNSDQLTSVGTNAFYKLNGELYRTGCSTAVDLRLE